MPVTLDQILASTARRPGGAPPPGERARSGRPARRPPPPSFAGALRRKDVAVIAEVKRRSPSAGVIRADLDPAERARLYAAARRRGHFGPHRWPLLRRLGRRSARGRSRACAVPVLRKDFILDELQILEARAAGAAAVLLIVRALVPGAARVAAALRRRYRGWMRSSRSIRRSSSTARWRRARRSSA